MIFFFGFGVLKFNRWTKKAYDQSCCPPVRTLHERDPHCARDPWVSGQHQCSRRMGGGWGLHIHGPDTQASERRQGWQSIGCMEKAQGIRSAFVQAFLGIQPAGIEHGWHYHELGHQGHEQGASSGITSKRLFLSCVFIRGDEHAVSSSWGILQRDGQDDRSHATNWYWLFSSV